MENRPNPAHSLPAKNDFDILKGLFWEKEECVTEIICSSQGPRYFLPDPFYKGTVSLSPVKLTGALPCAPGWWYRWHTVSTLPFLGRSLTLFLPTCWAGNRDHVAVFSNALGTVNLQVLSSHTCLDAQDQKKHWNWGSQNTSPLSPNCDREESLLPP